MKYLIIVLLFSIGFVGYGFGDELAYTSFYSYSEFTTHSIVAKDHVYGVPYSITTGESIDKMEINCSTSDLVLYLQRSGESGNLTIGLPRVLIDSKFSNGNDDVFFVLGDSKEIQFSEYVNEGLRVLVIPIAEKTEKITISGTNYPESPGRGSCNGVDEPPYSYLLLSPQKQSQNGITKNNIICKTSLELITKHDGTTPACVKSETKVKLIERGWGTGEFYDNDPAHAVATK